MSPGDREKLAGIIGQFASRVVALSPEEREEFIGEAVGRIRSLYGERHRSDPEALAEAKEFSDQVWIRKRELRMSQKPNRDIEKDYPLPQFVEKLRRLADALESGRPFEIQIAGERVSVPARATYNIEHERGEDEEEVEFQIKWTSRS
jgi:amphi-Trp domain-containing protein